MKYIFVFLISLTLVYAMIDVSECLLQPLGDVKHPAPREMRQVYCHPYYMDRMENITDVIKKKRRKERQSVGHRAGRAFRAGSRSLDRHHREGQVMQRF